MGRLIFSTDPAPPFRLDLTVWAIGRRPENAIDRWDGESHDYARVMRIVDQWRPYAGLIYFHLLLDGLERAGYLQQERVRAAG